MERRDVLKERPSRRKKCHFYHNDSSRLKDYVELDIFGKDRGTVLILRKMIFEYVNI